MFQDRLDAGSQLAQRLANLKRPKTVVLGIPRGGVVVAKPIADALEAPLSVLIVRKIGAPANEELALGAVSVDEKPVWNAEAMRILQPDSAWLEEKVRQKAEEVRLRKKAFGFSKLPPLKGKDVIVVDDGVATGASFEAALQWLKSQKPALIVAAVACAPTDTAQRLRRQVDEWICLNESPNFMAVGQFYRDFREVTDEEVKAILKKAQRRQRGNKKTAKQSKLHLRIQIDEKNTGV